MSRNDRDTQEQIDGASFRSSTEPVGVETASNGAGEASTCSSTAALATADQENWLKFEDCRFNTLRNAIYHSMRADKLDEWHRILIFLVVATGTAGVAGLLEPYVGSKTWAALTALIGTLDFVFNLKERSATHVRLKQEYYNIFASMEGSEQPSSRIVRKWLAELVRLTAEEPRTFRGLDAIAYNNAADALGRNIDFRLRISFLVGLFAHIYDFKSHLFETEAERRSAS